MRPLKEYLDELKSIAREAAKDTKIRGSHVAWAMMWVGVAVTGTMTYALCHKGMSNSVLWAGWVAFAAFLPVALMEGSALALVYGRHHWFRSRGQRALADVASWIIWIILALTTITHFALGNSTDGMVQDALQIYASYILPLSIVAIPMLWKRLYDAAPESEARIAVMEAEAELKEEIIQIEREKNALMIDAYRRSLDTDRVTAARDALFERASIEHAAEIAGFIEGTVVEAELEESEGDSEDGETGSAGAVPEEKPELLIEAGEIQESGSSGSGGLVNGKAH
jgi:hypothetical protein